MTKIDKTDLKLLQELESNARQPLSKIAKKLRTSQQVISYRINSLIERKIIGGFYTIIDLAKIGYTSYRTMIRLSNFDKTKHEQIKKFLIKHPNVLWFVDCGGRWDIIVNFMAKNIIQYSNLIKELKSKFPKQIQNYEILTTVEAIYFGRNYFTSKKRLPENLPSFGKESKIINLDETNLKILDLISENARRSSVEIADKLKISPNTILLKIKDLEKQRIIQGFKPLIHLEEIPYFAYKALIKFQNITEQKEKDLINHLKQNNSIVGIIKLVGSWDFEIEFEVKNQEEMLIITRKIRDKFKDITKNFEVIPLFHEYKYNFFPKDLLDNSSPTNL